MWSALPLIALAKGIAARACGVEAGRARGKRTARQRIDLADRRRRVGIDDTPVDPRVAMPHCHQVTWLTAGAATITFIVSSRTLARHRVTGPRALRSRTWRQTS
jgi:hypothetical protein